MQKIDKSIQRLERVIICFAFFVMVAVTFAQVIARFVFNDPISWSEEVARYLFVWITLLGAAHAVAFNKHFNVDFALSMFSKETQRKIGWAIALFVLLFALVMVGYGSYVAWFVRRQVSPAILLPMAYPYLCIPVSGVLIIVHLLAKLFGKVENAVPATMEGGAE